MKDRLGKLLLDLRIKAVIPYVEGELLDIGCGTNQLVATYKGHGIGVDVYAWENVDLVVKDTAQLPYNDSSFDTVTIIATLNHIPNRAAVLNEAYRVLKQSGYLIITMIPPTISRVWHFIRSPWDADQSERGMKEGEVYGIDRDGVKKLLDSSGFSVHKEKKFMCGINCLTIAVKKVK